MQGGFLSARNCKSLDLSEKKVARGRVVCASSIAAELISYPISSTSLSTLVAMLIRLGALAHPNSKTLVTPCSITKSEKYRHLLKVEDC